MESSECLFHVTNPRKPHKSDNRIKVHLTLQQSEKISADQSTVSNGSFSQGRRLRTAAAKKGGSNNGDENGPWSTALGYNRHGLLFPASCCVQKPALCCSLGVIVWYSNYDPKHRHVVQQAFKLAGV